MTLFDISDTAGSGGSTDGSCLEHDAECHHDHLGMEAIKLLHRQLDDDDNGDIDLSESDDVSFFYTLLLLNICNTYYLIAITVCFYLNLKRKKNGILIDFFSI